MPASSENKSKIASKPSANSVFDFLYNDNERIASFLSQFEPNGHLTNLKRTLSTAESASSATAMKGTGSIALAKGTFEANNTSQESNTAAEERAYDPLWSNALNFLEYLETNGLISRDIWQSNIGQFVLLKGFLTVLDVAMLRNAWNLPSIKRAMRAGIEQPPANRRDRRALGAQRASTPEEDGLELAIELLGILPHVVQARLLGDGYFAWCTLRQDRMLTNSGDLFLKHGLSIGGEWAMLGILDAHPSLDLAENTEMDLGVAAAFLGHLAPPARQVLGRPPQAHGVTPLLIFREVHG